MTGTFLEQPGRPSGETSQASPRARCCYPAGNGDWCGCGATWKWVEQHQILGKMMRLIIFRTVWQIPPEAACFGHWLRNYSRQDKQARQRTPAVSKIPTNDSLATGMGRRHGKRRLRKGLKSLSIGPCIRDLGKVVPERDNTPWMARAYVSILPSIIISCG